MFSVFKRLGNVNKNVHNSEEYEDKARHIKTVEINMIRLIKRAQNIATQAGGIGKDDMIKFTTYLNELRSYHKALNVFYENGVPLRNCNRLPEYARKIDFLAELVNEKRLKMGNKALRNQSDNPEESSFEYVALGEALKREEQHLRDLLFELPPTPHVFDDIKHKNEKNGSKSSIQNSNEKSNHILNQTVIAGPRPTPTKPIIERSTSTSELSLRRRLLHERRKQEETMEREQEVQRQLMNDLDDMVESLKHNVKQINRELKDGSGVHMMDRLEDVLDNNVDLTQHEVGRLKEHLSRSSSSTCQSWLLLILVFVMFVFTYIFMRIFSKPRV